MKCRLDVHVNVSESEENEKDELIWIGDSWGTCGLEVSGIWGYFELWIPKVKFTTFSASVHKNSLSKIPFSILAPHRDSLRTSKVKKDAFMSIYMCDLMSMYFKSCPGDFISFNFNFFFHIISTVNEQAAVKIPRPQNAHKT